MKWETIVTKVPNCLLKKVKNISISYWFLNAFEGQVHAYVPKRFLFASFWGWGFTQTGVTLYRCSLLHRPKKFLILNKDSNRGNEWCRMLRKMVGARGFEPPTPDTPCQCATRLRYAPKRICNLLETYTSIEIRMASTSMESKPSSWNDGMLGYRSTIPYSNSISVYSNLF